LPIFTSFSIKTLTAYIAVLAILQHRQHYHELPNPCTFRNIRRLNVG
jgi:hypothetical protein